MLEERLRGLRRQSLVLSSVDCQLDAEDQLLRELVEHNDLSNVWKSDPVGEACVCTCCQNFSDRIE